MQSKTPIKIRYAQLDINRETSSQKTSEVRGAIVITNPYVFFSYSAALSLEPVISKVDSVFTKADGILI